MPNVFFMWNRHRRPSRRKRWTLICAGQCKCWLGCSCQIAHLDLNHCWLHCHYRVRKDHAMTDEHLPEQWTSSTAQCLSEGQPECKVRVCLNPSAMRRRTCFANRPFQREIWIGELKDGVKPQHNGYFHGSCEGIRKRCGQDRTRCSGLLELVQ